jgi:hypothetical protein
MEAALDLAMRELDFGQREREKYGVLRQTNDPVLRPMPSPIPHYGFPSYHHSPRTLEEFSARLQQQKRTLENRNFAEEVNRNINLFLSRRGDFTNCLFRANRDFPYVVSLLRLEGVPDYLAYIALIESGYQADARSSSGEAGLWQLSPSLARQYGLRVENLIDERLLITPSTKAFARYIKTLYHRYGSWEQAVIEFSHERDYLAKLIAASEIATSPRKHGFYIDLPNMSGHHSISLNSEWSRTTFSTYLEEPWFEPLTY